MNRALLNSKSTTNNFLSLSLSVPCLEKISDSKWYRQLALCQCNLWASFAKALLYFVLRNKVIILASSLHCIQINCDSVWWVSADTSGESTAYITFRDARTSSRYCEGRAEPDGSLWGGRRGYCPQCGKAEPESHGLSYLPSKEQCIRGTRAAPVPGTQHLTWDRTVCGAVGGGSRRGLVMGTRVKHIPKVARQGCGDRDGPRPSWDISLQAGVRIKQSSVSSKQYNWNDF